jgi:hypothetical protein
MFIHDIIRDRTERNTGLSKIVNVLVFPNQKELESTEIILDRARVSYRLFK